MEKQCVVKEVSGDRARIECVREDACQNCSEACTACGKTVSVWVENRLSARVGDVVTVSDPELRFLPVCALVFFLPCLLAVLSLLVAASFTSRSLAAWICVAVFAVSFSASVFFLRKKKWDPVQMVSLSDLPIEKP